MNKSQRLALVLIIAIQAAPAFAQGKFDTPRDEPLFIGLPAKDPKVLASMEAARKSLPEFRKLIQAIGSNRNIPLVKSHFSEGQGVWMWLQVVEAKDNGFDAQTFEAPPELPALKKGTMRWIPNAAVADWMIVEEPGTLHGGYSLRLHRERLPEAERASFDRYIGARSYAPLPR